MAPLSFIWDLGFNVGWAARIDAEPGLNNWKSSHARQGGISLWALSPQTALSQCKRQQVMSYNCWMKDASEQ